MILFVLRNPMVHIISHNFKNSTCLVTAPAPSTLGKCIFYLSLSKKKYRLVCYNSQFSVLFGYQHVIKGWKSHTHTYNT